MTEQDRIVDQIKRAYEGNAWHGPAVQEVLAGVTADVASRRPVATAHSIWELVLHIAAWADIVRRRVGGEVLDVTPTVNFPPVSDTSDVAWQNSLRILAQSQHTLLALIPTLSDSRLDEHVMTGGTSVYVQLHGVAQHHVYHAGQIAILKKCL